MLFRNFEFHQPKITQSRKEHELSPLQAHKSKMLKKENQSFALEGGEVYSGFMEVAVKMSFFSFREESSRKAKAPV